MEDTILGKIVKEKVTGLEGTVISKHIYLYGSSQYGIQPCQNVGTDLPKVRYFDEGRVVVINDES